MNIGWINLPTSAINVGLFIWNYHNHDIFWSIFNGILATICFGNFIKYLFDQTTKPKEPVRKEDLYH